MLRWWPVLLMPLLVACGGGQPAAASAPAPAAAATSSSAPAQTRAATASTAPAAASLAAVSSPPPGAPAFGRGTVVIQAKGGLITVPVEIADDETKREYGLMNRRSLPADAGMLFVFQPPADAKQIGFWMKDTLIPLSIAFIEPSLVIESIQDMQAMTEDIHYAPRNYAYALETNIGYFASHGVAAGDKVSIQQS